MTTAAILCALSALEGVELLQWQRGGDDPLVAAKGQLVPERRFRRARAGVEHCWRGRAEGASLRLRSAPHASNRSWPLDAWGRALESLGGPDRAGVMPDAALLHDVAHLVLRARLELESESEQGRAAARDALAQLESELDGGLTPEQPWLLRRRVELEFEHARAQASSRGDCELSLDIDPLLEVTRDARLAGRLLRNVLLNAMHAGPRGSRIHVDAIRQSGSVRIRIRDEGRGMSSAAARGLPLASTIPARGRGIGMHSVRRCAKLLRADLEVTSNRGAGTTTIIRWEEDSRSGVCVAVPTLAWRRYAADSERALVPVAGAASEETPLVPSGCASLVIARGSPNAWLWIQAAASAGVSCSIRGIEGEEMRRCPPTRVAKPPERPHRQ